MPHEAIDLLADDPRVLALADALWDRKPADRLERARSLRLGLRVAPGVPHGSVGAASLSEEWRVGRGRVELSLGNQLGLTIDIGLAASNGWTTEALLEREPALVGRLLLETPAAALLERRAYAAVHAGAVAGPAGAVVIRGAPGAGKSTLVAAAHCAGLEVLGDKSVLAARREPDELLAAIRGVTLHADAVALLGLSAELLPDRAVSESKARLALPPLSGPAARRRRRVATVVLGERNGGPARLEAMDRPGFLREFQLGGIPQERWSGTPTEIATHWSGRGAYRLAGTADLGGAVELLAALVGLP